MSETKFMIYTDDHRQTRREGASANRAPGTRVSGRVAFVHCTRGVPSSELGGLGAGWPRWVTSPSSTISPAIEAVASIELTMVGHAGSAMADRRFRRTRDLAETPVDSALQRARFAMAP